MELGTRRTPTARSLLLLSAPRCILLSCCYYQPKPQREKVNNDLADGDNKEQNSDVHYQGEAILLDGRLDRMEECRADSQRRDDEYKQRQLRLTTWTLILTAVLAFGEVIIGGVSIYQIHTAKIAANAAQTAAQAALDNVNIAYYALVENEETSAYTLGQMAAQSDAQQKAADAAKSAAVTARDTLHMSERAYITFGTPQMDIEEGALSIPVINSGHIPSGRAELIFHEPTINVANPSPAPVNLVAAAERHWSRHKFEYIAPGLPITLKMPIKSMDAAKYRSGHQMIEVAGFVIYKDGFPTTPQQRLSFCTNTVWHEIFKTVSLIPCDSGDQIPKLASLDGYPNDEKD